LYAVANLGEGEVEVRSVPLAALRYDAPEAAGGKDPGGPPRLYQACKTYTFMMLAMFMRRTSTIHGTVLEVKSYVQVRSVC
jgi:hypothetical protein